jgi:hypothetical protein
MRRILLQSLFVFVCAAPVSAQLTSGDIVFLQDSPAVLKADPVTGARTIISQFGVRGTGPNFGNAGGAYGGLVVSPTGEIFVHGANTAIYKIDPVTGNRTIISDNFTGTGPSMYYGEGDIILGQTGELFAVAANSDAIVAIDPANGNRSIVSGLGVGSGPVLAHPYGLTITPDGDFYAFITSASPVDDLVFFVDRETGNRTIVSGGGIGSGPEFSRVGLDTTLLPDGDLAVVDGANRILRVDPTTGDRSILAGLGVGSGPSLPNLGWVSLDSSGRLIVTNVDGVFRVDPVSGDRTLITGTTFGSGPIVGGFREAVEFHAIPEPSTFILAGIAGVALFVVGRRRLARS